MNSCSSEHGLNVHRRDVSYKAMSHHAGFEARTSSKYDAFIMDWACKISLLVAMTTATLLSQRCENVYIHDIYMIYHFPKAV